MPVTSVIATEDQQHRAIAINSGHHKHKPIEGVCIIMIRMPQSTSARNGAATTRSKSHDEALNMGQAKPTFTDYFLL